MTILDHVAHEREAIKEALRLAGEATNGPWDTNAQCVRVNEDGKCLERRHHVESAEKTIATFLPEANAAFIAQSRTLLPALAQAYERALNAIELLVKQRDEAMEGDYDANSTGDTPPLAKIIEQEDAAIEAALRGET